MSIAEHWVAHTRGGDCRLVEPDRAAWLWPRLCRAAPDALSCVLMPDHLHLVTPPGGPAPLRDTLKGYAHRFGVRFDILEPQPAHSRAIALRQVRYGFFNPVRAGLVDDPWSWRWSTLRDLAGAAAPLWTPLPIVASRLELRPARALRKLTTLAEHHPPLPDDRPPFVASFPALVAAVASALRIPERDVSRLPRARRLIVQAAYAIGTPRAADLAAALGCHPATIHRTRQTPAPALPAVLRCLADLRLLR